MKPTLQAKNIVWENGKNLHPEMAKIYERHKPVAGGFWRRLIIYEFINYSLILAGTVHCGWSHEFREFIDYSHDFSRL